METLKLESLIRDIKDWPKPGILFKDISPLLKNPAGLALAVEMMANPFRGQGIQIVAGAESRGFIFGTAIAQALSAGFVPIRKPKKLPYQTYAIEYDLEYGKDRLEIHTDAVTPGQRVLVVDDVLATGGTMKACCDLIKQSGGIVAGVTVLMELTFLNGRAKCLDHGDIHAVLKV